MSRLVASYHANTPLIVTSGQQHRALVIGQPYLGNREATTMPKPWVTWSYEPARAEDVPEASCGPYAMARQLPASPVYLVGTHRRLEAAADWPCPRPDGEHWVAPDAERLWSLAKRISASRAE